MSAVHVYMKGKNGWGIFYSIEDCLVYYTAYSSLVKEMGLHVIAFCLMFNHSHSLLDSVDLNKLQSFQRRIGTVFTKNYNAEHSRKGRLFHKAYGFSLKRQYKIILACIAYIFNNPVAGRMYQKSLDCRWTLLAYYNNPHPFSNRLVKRNCRHIMREAIKVVDIYYNEGKYLSYTTLRRIFKGLNKNESSQLIDYIISKYNFLDYDRLINYYGSYEKMLIAIESNAGAEHNIPDDYGDHSNYMKMTSLLRKKGFKQWNPEILSMSETVRLSRYMYESVHPFSDQIRKFFHLPKPKEQNQ